MISNKDRILDISVNLARVSDWILSDSPSKKNLIDRFLEETKTFVISLSTTTVSSRFQPTFTQFKTEFKGLLKDRNQLKKEEWAERALTWANILQHRAKLA